MEIKLNSNSHWLFTFKIWSQKIECLLHTTDEICYLELVSTYLTLISDKDNIKKLFNEILT